QRLGTQEAPVGVEADLPQGGEVAERSADLEVVGVVDDRLGAQGAVVLVVLLDLRSLVINMQRRHYPFGENAGAERSRRRADDLAVEDQLNLARAADIQVLPDDLFEEAPSRHGAVEDLSQGELRL